MIILKFTAVIISIFMLIYVIILDNKKRKEEERIFDEKMEKLESRIKRISDLTTQLKDKAQNKRTQGELK